MPQRQTVDAECGVELPHGLHALPIPVWCASADGSNHVFNTAWTAHTGIAPDTAGWAAAIHPDDRAESAARWATSTLDGAPFEMPLRLRRADGSHGWVMAAAIPDRTPDGTITRWVGTATDIDALKAAADQAALVSGELAHRIGNIFAVVDSVLALSARERPEAADFSNSAAARIAALARAHDFVWPTTRQNTPQQMQALIGLLLHPYDAGGGPAISIAGDDVGIGGATATCVALIVHELATNAVKHGALATHHGRLAVRLRKSPAHLTLIWSETGGSIIEKPPVRTGFGTALLCRTMKMGQVGHARCWWRRDGLVVALRFSLAALSR